MKLFERVSSWFKVAMEAYKTMLDLYHTHKRDVSAFAGALAGSGYSSLHASVPIMPNTPDGILSLQFPGTRSGALAELSLLDQAQDVKLPWT